MPLPSDFETHPVGTAQAVDDALEWMDEVEDLIREHFGNFTRRKFGLARRKLRASAEARTYRG